MYFIIKILSYKSADVRKIIRRQLFQVVYVVKTQILRVLEWGSKPHLGAKGQTAKHLKSSYQEEIKWEYQLL